MTISNKLSPFELKSFIYNLIKKINSVEDIKNCVDDFELLDTQHSQKLITKLLFNELLSSNIEKIPVICFILQRYTPKEELIALLWQSLKKNNLNNDVKICIINLLRQYDSSWSYETCEEYVEDAKSLFDENTKQLLNSAIINPEAQIDFMDFLQTLRTEDKLSLLNSFADDFDSDALANILIPVFLSDPNSPEGGLALKLLSESKSQLAFHVLEDIKHYVSESLLKNVNKAISTLKISGIRVDNTADFYKKILSDSKIKDCYITYPDFYGNSAIIFTRITRDNKIRFVSIVINCDNGIKDGFGFFEISEFESSKIIERFLKNEKSIKILPKNLKHILNFYENVNVKKNKNCWNIPYEYICWKNLLLDIDNMDITIENLLKNNNFDLDQSDNYYLQNVFHQDISEHWFVDIDYSIEFNAFMKKVCSNDNMTDIIISEVNNVFDKEEYQGWQNKLFLSSYIKYLSNDLQTSKFLYNITNNDKLMNEFLILLLKKSVFEYLLFIKLDNSKNIYGLTYEQIQAKINYIKKNWIFNE